jgi:pilus assembly protein CpaC
MHRTSRAPRFLAWALFIAVSLSAAAPIAGAQEKLLPPNVDGDVLGRIEVVGVSQTRKIQMTTKAPLKAYEIDFPNLVRFDKVDKDLTSVFITGLMPGRAVVTLTDVTNKVERVVVVVDDSEQRKAELQDVIRKIAPTAVVQITVAQKSVILTGVVTDVDTAQRIMEAARGIFSPPSAIVPGAAAANGAPISAVTIFNGMRIGGVQQVQLEVLVAVVNRSRMRQMDFSFIVNGGKYVFNSWLNSPLQFSNALSTAVGGATTLAPNVNTPTNISFGVVGSRDSLSAFLGALNTEGLTKILADTRVSTLSGKQGQIVSGGETPILTSSGTGAPSVTYKSFGTVVTFLPVVLDGKIHLEIHSELSAINAANGITIPGVVNTVVPGFDTRMATVAVQLEDGQTLAVGGLIQNTVNATIQRVPVLGDLPLIGMAFTNKSYKETEEELLILVTPRLVDGIACNQIPKFLPGRETRIPDDFELFLEGIMEAPRGPRTVNGPRNGYQGAHMLSANIGQIPCAGPGGAGCGSGCATPLSLGGQVGAAPALASPAPLPIDAPPAIQPTPLPTTTTIPERPSSLPPIRDLSQPAAPMLPVPMAPPFTVEPAPMLPPPASFGPAVNDVR